MLSGHALRLALAAVLWTCTAMNAGPTPANAQMWPPPGYYPPTPGYPPPGYGIPPQIAPMGQAGQRCASTAGVCFMGQGGPLGRTCFCQTPYGQAPGQIIP